jgi:uncharacterized repeat protein (TIGR01451 family)
MASRGIWRIMSARARRGLALSWTTLFVLSLLLQYFTFATASSALGANATGNKLLGGFEVDGDLFSGTMSPAGDDWAKGASGSGLLTSPTITDPIGNADTSNFSTGSKENDAPSTWDGGTGTASPKDDMGNIYIGSQLQPLPPGANSHLWTFLGVERASNNGTTFFDFEFNQKANVTNANGISVPHRTAGDILLVAQQQGSGSFDISATIQKWTGSAWGAAIPANSSEFYGLSNDGDIPAGPWTDQIASGGTIPVRQFAEMAFDLSALGVVLNCPSEGFGEVNVRTRSAITASAALKDYASAPIRIPPNCASLSWKKQDDQGHALGGATFTVDPNPFTGSGASVDFTDYVSSSAQSDSTADQDKRAGFFNLINVVPGTYTVTEKTAPAGYIKDPTSKSITLSVFEEGSISYIWENPAQAHPTLTTSLVGGTTANGKSTLTLSFGTGTSVSFADSAVFGSLNASHKPTGSVVYHLYNSDCSTEIDTSTVTIAGDGTIPNSKTFTLDAVGTYNVVATYAGDVYNAAAHNDCGDEVVKLGKNKPTITTTAEESVNPGLSINDQASLSGTTSDAGGSIVFNAYGPTDATCAGTAAFTSSPITVHGDGTYGPVSFTPASAGTYRWIASYSGDAKNAATAGACNADGENDTVNKLSPTVVTHASATVQVGGQITDTATLAGGFNPTGTITFRLYGPNDATCATVIATRTRPVAGNGDYVSNPFTTATAGTYRWIANYGGDANNDATANVCNATNESVVITQAHPTIATLATEGGAQGALIHDTATVSGAFNPSGTVTFSLYGIADPSCSGTPVFTSTVAIASNGTATSGTFAAPTSGTYHWIASYSGDANNVGVSGACGNAGETTIINQFAPSITTVLHSGDLAGAKITVLFDSAVTDQATLANAGPTASGSVTYKVFSDNTCQTLFANAGEKTVNNGSVGASDPVTFPAAGTYYWQAHYSGDLNNAPATSACTDEVLTVTSPNLDVVKLVAVNGGAFAHSGPARPGDTLHYQITVSNSGNAAATNVPVSDDIAAILAHATYNADCSAGCSRVGSVLSWTIPSIAAGGNVVLTFSVTLDATFPTGTTNLPNVVLVTGPGSNCAAGSTDVACDTNTTVASSILAIAKSFTGNTGGIDPILDVPLAKIGDTLHYTLSYTGGGPLTNAVITDVLPVGLDYVVGSAAGDANFTFSGYDTATRTLTWNAATLPNPASGSVTYNVTVLTAAPEQPQPLTNTATIDSAQTAPDSDTAQVAVVAPPLAATGTPRITPPPTDTFTPETGASNPGFTLMLILLGLAGLAVSIGFVTPTPERVRRRDRRG